MIAPQAMESSGALSGMFKVELALCGVGGGATVGVLTQGMKRARYAEAFQAAARALGAETFHVDIPSDGAPDDGGELGVRAAQTGLQAFPATLVETFSRCDLMVDLVFLLWSDEQQAIRAAGTRIISCVEPPQALRRLFPDADIRRRVIAARERLEHADGHTAVVRVRTQHAVRVAVLAVGDLAQLARRHGQDVRGGLHAAPILATASSGIATQAGRLRVS